MTRSFSHQFEGRIWKMDIHEETGLLGIEWRTEEGVPHFSVIHYPDGNLLLADFSYGDRWWTLAGITAESLLLQHFPQPNQAHTRGLVAIDILQQKIRWERFDLQFVEVVQEGIAVQPGYLEPHQVMVFTDQDNKPLFQTISLDQLTPLSRGIQSAQPTDAVPATMLSENPVVGPYFYLPHQGKELWAYHEADGPSFKLMLAILENGRIVYQDCLADKLSYLLPEVFFTIGQQLFFIRNNKQEIVSYFV